MLESTALAGKRSLRLTAVLKRCGGRNMADTVRVLSTLALKGAVAAVAAQYEAAHGVRIDADFAPTLALLQRLRAARRADLVILTREGLDETAREGRVVAAMRRSGALLCRHRGQGGASHPGHPTEAALRATLLGRARWPIRGSAPAASCSRS